MEREKKKKNPIFLFPGSFREYTLQAQSFVRTRGQAYLDFDKTMPKPILQVFNVNSKPDFGPLISNTGGQADSNLTLQNSFTFPQASLSFKNEENHGTNQHH